MSDAKQPLLPADPPPSYTPTTTKNSLLKPRPPFPLELPVLTSLRSKRVILASASPRRRALLAQIGLTNLEIKASSFAENLPKSLGGFEYVLQTATQKAMAVYESSIDQKGVPEPELLLAADTVVVSGATGGILEKPRSEVDHIRMLKMLRDNGRHSVITAVVAMAPLESARDPGYAMQSVVEETKVVFDPNLGDDILEAYVKTREGADKAGGYAIQGIGALLVERIEGSYDNVVGLPLRKTLEVIEKVLMEAKGVNVDEDELVDED